MPVHVTLFLALASALCVAAYASDHEEHSQCTQLRILSPKNRSDVTSATVEIKLEFPPHSDQNEFRAELDGKDVTRHFGPLHNHIRRGFFNGHNLKQGKNVFTAGDERARAEVQFDYAPSGGSGAPGATDASSQAPYVPIQTGVVKGDGQQITDYGIQIGSETYYAPAGTYTGFPGNVNGGFQLLILDRLTLTNNSGDTTSPIANISFSADASSDVTAMANYLLDPASYSGCGEFGCLVVLQSFAGVGAAEEATSKSLLQAALSTIGATGNLASKNYPSTTTYSLITTVNLQGVTASGSGFERIRCASGGDKCGLATQSGVLIFDNENAYAFASPTRYPFSIGTAPNSTSNTVTVGNALYTSATMSSGQGGFQVVALDRQSLQPLQNKTYAPINCTDGQTSECNTAIAQLASMDTDLTTLSQNNCPPAGDGCPLFFVSSVGTVYAPQPTALGITDQALAMWHKVAADLRDLGGGTYSLFSQLQSGDDYALLGSSNGAPLAFPVAEASSIVSRATEPQGANTLPSNIRGVLSIDHTGGYSPHLSNLTFDFGANPNSLLDQIALQPTVAWPYSQTKADQAILSYLSYKACPMGCTNISNIRTTYTNSAADFNGYQQYIGNASYPETPTTKPPYTKAEFKKVQSQLVTELGYVQNVQNVQIHIDAFLSGKNSTVSEILTADYANVAGNLKPKTTKSASFDSLGFAGSLVGVGSYVPVVGAAFGITADALDVASYLSHNSDGQSSLDESGLLHTTFANITTDVVNQFNASADVTGNLFDLVVTDWGKLSVLGPAAENNEFPFDNSEVGHMLDSADRSARERYLISLMAGVFTIEHDLNISQGAPTKGFISQCDQVDDPTVYYVDGVITTTYVANPTSQSPSPGFDGQSYDGYVLLNVPVCPSYTSAGGVSSTVVAPLFAPLDPGDTSKLGLYTPWFYVHQKQIAVWNVTP